MLPPLRLPTSLLRRLCAPSLFHSDGAAHMAFVGHSQGTTQLFAALAAQPALRSRLSVAVMLAPAVHMRGIHAPMMQILAAMDADRVGGAKGCLAAAWAALLCCLHGRPTSAWEPTQQTVL